MDMQIPGFDIDSELGQGAMASVYLATQRSCLLYTSDAADE